MTVFRLAAAAVLAALSGFYFHVFYGRGWANAYVQAQAAASRLNDVVREPYPDIVVLVATLTSLIPMTFKVLLFVLVREQLPGRSGAAKGLLFGFALLVIGDNFIRIPIMNVVVGNPVDVMLVQSAESWVYALLTGLIIGVLVPAGADQPLRRWLSLPTR